MASPYVPDRDMKIYVADPAGAAERHRVWLAEDATWAREAGSSASRRLPGGETLVTVTEGGPGTLVVNTIPGHLTRGERLVQEAVRRNTNIDMIIERGTFREVLTGADGMTIAAAADGNGTLMSADVDLTILPVRPGMKLIAGGHAYSLDEIVDAGEARVSLYGDVVGTRASIQRNAAGEDVVAVPALASTVAWTLVEHAIHQVFAGSIQTGSGFAFGEAGVSGGYTQALDSDPSDSIIVS